MFRVSCISWILQFATVLLLPSVVMAETDLKSEVKKPPERVWGKPVEGQRLSISAEKRTYCPGERIFLNICFQNVGQTDVEITVCRPLGVFEINVLLPEGKPAPFTLKGKRSYDNSSMGSMSARVVKPQEQICTDIELNRLFDMTLNGKYSVTVRRIVWKAGVFQRNLKAVSNTLEITVDESLDRRQK